MNDLRHLHAQARHLANPICARDAELYAPIKLYVAADHDFILICGEVAITATTCTHHYVTGAKGVVKDLRLTLAFRTVKTSLDDCAAMKDRDGDLERPIRDLVKQALPLTPKADRADMLLSLPARIKEPLLGLL